MKHQLLNDALLLIGGVFIAGARAYVGKWMFVHLLKFGRWLLVRGESEVKLYHEFLLEELAKKYKSK